jgi:hypothetical protein
LPFLGDEFRQTNAGHRAIKSAIDKCPEDFWARFGVFDKDLVPKGIDPDRLRLVLFGAEMSLLLANAEQLGVGLSTWSEDFQEAAWAVRKILLRRARAPVNVLDRRGVETRLGQVILETYLPTVEDLPLEEILEIRRRRSPELAAFRSGVREIAAQIDPAKPPKDLGLALHDIMSIKVDPAIRNLKAAMYSARLDALKKLGQSWESLAKITVPAALAFAAGAHLDVAALAGVAGAISSTLIDGVVERKKLLHGSQWGVLVKLQDQYKNTT